MPDDVPPLRLMYEAVAAVAGVFGASVALGNGVNAVAEQAAQVADLLGEAVALPVRIGVAPEQQWMPAADTGVFGVSVAAADHPIRVVTQEAGQCVADAHLPAVVAEHRRAAPGAAAALAGERLVVHRVSPDGAPQSSQHGCSSLSCLPERLGGVPSYQEGADRGRNGSRDVYLRAIQRPALFAGLVGSAPRPRPPTSR
jgi:hypothetical protein